MNRTIWRFSRLAGVMLACGLLAFGGPAAAQQPAQKKIDTEALFKADKPAEIIKLLGISADVAKIPPSNYLLLEVAPIAAPGPIPVRLMSELPNTDLLLLFNRKPRDKEPSLLAAQIVDPGAPAELKTSIEQTHHTELMLIARAAGKLYAVKAPLLLAEKDAPEGGAKGARKARKNARH